MYLKNFLVSFCLLFFTLSSLAQQTERITNFEVLMEVNTDRSIDVTEKITVYAAGDVIKRGLTRSLPTSRELNGRSMDMDYQIQEVWKNDRPENYFKESGGGHLILYIGERDVFLNPGLYTYRIKYHVPDQIGFFEEYDEIYWNAIGTDVVFPIEQASCRVVFPQGTNIMQESAYVGFYGQAAGDYTVSQEGSEVFFQTTRPLQPREGFTIAVGFGKGLVEGPGFFEQFGTIVIIFLGVFFLIPYYIYTWYRYGQDPPTPASYPIYESPDGLSPASINYILKEGYQTKSLIASVIDLAIKGYLKIEEQEGGNFLFKSKNYALMQVKPADGDLPVEERKLMEILFAGRDTVSIDGEYHPYVEKAYAGHQANLDHRHRAFIKKGNNSKFLFLPVLVSIGVGGVGFFLMALSPYAAGVNIFAVLIFVLLAIIAIFLYTYLIKRPSVEKLELQSRIKGFRMYLEMAEKDRLNLLNPPEMTPEHFEAALPYAFALGVEHQWAERFKNILEAAQYRPQWNNSVTPIYFADSFGRGFSNNFVSSASKPAESGGGSGSLGGGFSGGGGGGGGVGGW